MGYQVAGACGTIGLCALLAAGCQPPHSSAHPSSPPAAKVTKTVAEAELNTVELTEAAEKRLDIQTAEMVQRSMVRQRSYGAEIALPTGATVIVAAPLAGTVELPPGKKLPEIGQRVAEKEPLLSLLPLLSPERSVLTPAERIRFSEARTALAQSRIDAGGQLQQAEVQVEAAEIALARAERLLREQAGTVRAVDEAKAQLQLAQKVWQAADTRKKLVDSVNFDEEAGQLTAITISAPMTGILRTLPVRPGEMLAPGALLFEVMNDDEVWVKTPVYVGDLDEIDRSQPARLTLLDGRRAADDVLAQPVMLPPTAAPLAAAVDLYYSLPNATHRFSPGQRVTAHLRFKGSAEQLALPWSAVIHDIYGGQWVYEQVAERKYARRRVEIGWVSDGWAVVLRGPAAGARVVTAGAAELAGTEFGFAK